MIFLGVRGVVVFRALRRVKAASARSRDCNAFPSLALSRNARRSGDGVGDEDGVGDVDMHVENAFFCGFCGRELG